MSHLIPSLPLRVLTPFQFTPLRFERGTVAGAAGHAVVGLGHAAVRTDGLLCLAAPAVITAVDIISRFCRERRGHEEFLRPERAAEGALQRVVLNILLHIRIVCHFHEALSLGDPLLTFVSLWLFQPKELSTTETRR